MTDISLIICTRNREDMIEELLSSAKNQSFQNYEVLVVDDGTNFKTKEILSKYPHFTYIEGDKKGLAEARNKGVKSSTGKIIVFVDDDVVFSEDYLTKVMNCFNTTEADFIGGKTHIKSLSPKPEWIDGPLLGVLAFSDYGDELKEYDNYSKHVPYGCNMAIRREILEKIEGFSSSNRSLENEDVIIGNKLRNMGCKLFYCPEMFLYHKMPPDRLNYKYYKKRYYSQGKSDIYTYYLLKDFSLKEIPQKIILHTQRLMESLFLRFFQNILYKKYYQKLRLYYNLGCIEELLKILFNKEK